MSRDVPTRLVLVGELLWAAKQFVECFLGLVSPRRWSR